MGVQGLIWRRGCPCGAGGAAQLSELRNKTAKEGAVLRGLDGPARGESSSSHGAWA